MEKWIFEQHENTNHKYDNYLPYEFHLKMVKQVADRFFYLLPENLFTKNNYLHGNEFNTNITQKVITLACYGHDLIEDTRVTYNDVKEKLGLDVANIIYALTNEKGRTRNERANDKYYQGILEQSGAVFVKLCDRIANVKYSKETKSGMFKKYQEENNNFLTKLNLYGVHEFRPMVNELIELLK